jgi:hypothetical protein
VARVSLESSTNGVRAKMSEGLKPCPFCGAEYHMTDDTDCYLTIDHKPNCLFNFFGERYMTTRIQKNFKPGIEAWNRRVN